MRKGLTGTSMEKEKKSERKKRESEWGGGDILER